MDFSKLTVVQLKQELGKRGLAVKGTKLTLIERLTQSMDSKSEVPVSPAATLARMPSSDQGKRATRAALDQGSPTKRKATALFAEPVEGNDELIHIPTYVYKKVEYKQKGEVELSPAEAKVFDFIAAQVTFPKDFESNKMYGSLSGSSYEERAIISYAHGLFDEALLTPLASKLRPVVRKAMINGLLEDAAAAIEEETALS